MRRRVLACALAALAPSLAAAQEVRVRTGEHEGFTRMVVDFADLPEWSLAPDDGGVILRTGLDRGFDLSAVYRRIARERIAAIRPAGEGALRIDLGCPCDITTFELGGGGLVIDVADDDGDGRASIDGREMADGGARIALETMARDLVVVPGLLRDAGEGDPAVMLRRARLGEVRRAVSDGVARGRAQGLIRPAEGADADSAGIVPEPASPVPDLSAFENVRVGTQIDRDRRPVPRAGCLPEEAVAIGGWGDETLEIADLGRVRMEAFSEEAAPESAALRELAQDYLYLTLGAEAREVLRLDPVQGERHAVLGRIAVIMDGGSADAAMAEHAACGGAATMWAILGGQSAPEAALQSGLAAFDGLPTHLRRHLGPPLARRLIDQGHLEEARLVERAIGRGSDAPVPDAALIEADLSLREGRTDEGRDLLEGVASSGVPQAGEAMADLLASLGASGEAAPLQLIEQARALRFELDGPVAAALDSEIVLALGRTGRFEAAMEHLGGGALDAATRDDLRDDVYDMVLETDDLIFIETAARLLDGPRPGEVESLAIASRLADHGLSSQARLYLDGIAGPPRREERLIRARLAKIDGDADSAETYLAGLDGDEVEAIRDGLNLPPRVLVTLEPAAPEAGAPAPLAGVPTVSQRGRDALAESAALRDALSRYRDAQ